MSVVATEREIMGARGYGCGGLHVHQHWWLIRWLRVLGFASKGVVESAELIYQRSRPGSQALIDDEVYGGKGR